MIVISPKLSGKQPSFRMEWGCGCHLRHRGCMVTQWLTVCVQSEIISFVSTPTPHPHPCIMCSHLVHNLGVQNTEMPEITPRLHFPFEMIWIKLTCSLNCETPGILRILGSCTSNFEGKHSFHSNKSKTIIRRKKERKTIFLKLFQYVRP